MNKQLCIVCIVCLTFLFSCKSSDIKNPLVGKWQTQEAQRGPEKYLSDEIEFFQDGTVTLSDFPGKRLPFRTELTKEENGLLKKNYPGLEGKNILLILIDPSQQDWMKKAMAYQYTVTEKELSLSPVIGDNQVKFRRVASGK